MTSYEESDLSPNFLPRATQPTEEHACRLLRPCRISLERRRSHKEIGKLRKVSPNLCQTVSYRFPLEALRHKATLRTWQHNSSRTMAKKKKCGITSRVLDDLFLVLLVDQLPSSQAAQLNL